MAPIRANSVLPARREVFAVPTADGQTLVGEVALPLHAKPAATVLCLHPLSTHGGSTDSHIFRKAAWRLPALADLAVVRFNFRGVASTLGKSSGDFDEGEGEGLDLDAVLSEIGGRGLPDPWLLAWSFGTDVALRHGNRDPVLGALLLAPTLRWSSDTDLMDWGLGARPMTVLVPEFDDFLPPAQARPRFDAVPQAEFVAVEGGRHLFVGERYVKIVLDRVVARVLPDAGPLPSEWDGPMETWSPL